MRARTSATNRAVNTYHTRGSNLRRAQMAHRTNSLIFAVRLACSDSLAEPNDATFEALKRRHPPACPDSSLPPAPPQPEVDDIFAVSEEMIICAIRSFPLARLVALMV